MKENKENLSWESLSNDEILKLQRNNNSKISNNNFDKSIWKIVFVVTIFFAAIGAAIVWFFIDKIISN